MLSLSNVYVYMYVQCTLYIILSYIHACWFVICNCFTNGGGAKNGSGKKISSSEIDVTPGTAASQLTQKVQR